MKTTKIQVQQKEFEKYDFGEYICGHCFADVDLEDGYCWSCGLQFSAETPIVVSFEELKKFNEQEKEE